MFSLAIGTRYYKEDKIRLLQIGLPVLNNGLCREDNHAVLEKIVNHYNCYAGSEFYCWFDLEGYL
jgi:hypothetical protein